MTVDELLKSREKYLPGSPEYRALISQTIKDLVRSYLDPKADDVSRECLDMIAHKLARILGGKWDHIDNWEDIAGYAMLAANELRKMPPQD